MQSTSISKYYLIWIAIRIASLPRAVSIAITSNGHHGASRKRIRSNEPQRKQHANSKCTLIIMMPSLDPLFREQSQNSHKGWGTFSSSTFLSAFAEHLEDCQLQQSGSMQRFMCVAICDIFNFRERNPVATQAGIARL